MVSGPLWLPPAYGELADDQDELGWDVDLHGRMVDEAAEDDAVETALWTPDDDAAFRSYALGVDPLVLGGRKLDLPAVLRSFGLVVEVVPGWETRGSSTFNPGGVVGHHTAGPATGDRPSLRICTHGRSDLPGPLCQVFLTRAGVAIVVAAGRANHAGTGGFRGLVGNSAVFGIEAESKGTLPNAWTPAQLVAYPKVVAALLKLAGRDESWYCRHATWAPKRKIDTVELTDAWMRTRAGVILKGGTVAPGKLGDRILKLTSPIMRGDDVKEWQTLLNQFRAGIAGTPDGAYGANTNRATQTFMAEVMGVKTDDPQVGPKTIQALRDHLAKKPAPAPAPAPPATWRYTMLLMAARGVDFDSATAVLNATNARGAVTTNAAEAVEAMDAGVLTIYVGAPAVREALKREPTSMGVSWHREGKVATVAGATALDTLRSLTEVAGKGWKP